MVIVPDEQRTPKGACAALNDWTTDRIDFYPANVPRSREGAAFYKARYWHLDYDGER